MPSLILPPSTTLETIPQRMGYLMTYERNMGRMRIALRTSCIKHNDHLIHTQQRSVTNSLVLNQTCPALRISYTIVHDILQQNMHQIRHTLFRFDVHQVCDTSNLACIKSALNQGWFLTGMTTPMGNLTRFAGDNETCFGQQVFYHL